MAKLNYPKLPLGFKKKWVKALRSGNYKQGSHTLKERHSDGVIKYCCLGVACEVAEAKIPYKHNNVSYIQKDSGIRGISKIPAMLIGDESDYKNDLAEKLAGMNDSGRWSFDKIATWIEVNL